jgi:hydroxylamine dehydrogenase
MKRIILIVALLCGLGGLVAAGSIVANAKTAPNQAKQKEFRMERKMPEEAVACIECHKKESPGIFYVLPTESLPARYVRLHRFSDT